MTIIDSQVHAYEANTPKRPWHSVPNWPDHVTGDETSLGKSIAHASGRGLDATEWAIDDEVTRAGSSPSCRLTRVRMRFSTCSTEISLFIRPSTFSSRSLTAVVSRIACRSGILRARCAAIMSASLA